MDYANTVNIAAKAFQMRVALALNRGLAMALQAGIAPIVNIGILMMGYLPRRRNRNETYNHGAGKRQCDSGGEEDADKEGD
jgi:hypothetical protein